MYKPFPPGFQPAPDFDPFKSRVFQSSSVRDAYYPPHPYPPQDVHLLSAEERKLLHERLRLLDVFGQIMLKKYEEGVTDKEITALAEIICDAYEEWVKAGRPPFPQ